MDKFKYYITDAEERVYPKTDVKYSYSRERDERFIRLKINSSLTFGDRLVNGTAVNDYTLLKSIESQRKTPIKIYKLQSDGSYDLFITGILDLTGSWDGTLKTVNCGVVTNDDYKFLKNTDKKFNILQLGLTATDVKHTVTDPLDTTISNTYLLQSVLEIIFQNIFDNENAAFTSQFLTSGTNPVTGSSSETTKIYISHKQSVVDTASSPEVLELSFDDIMKYLRTQFGLYWYISGNTLIVENLKFFENDFSYSSARTVGIDLTDYTNNTKSYSGSLILNKDKYKYDVSKLVSEEKFIYQEWENKNFRDLTISYDVDLIVDKKSEERINASNDIAYILDNTDISINGVCFLATAFDSPNFVLIERNVTVQSNELEIISNFSFDTLKFTGNNITSAIADGASTKTFNTNNVQVAEDDSVLITFNLTLLSGTVPDLQFMNQGYIPTNEGLNSYTYISEDEATLWWYLIFRAVLATNFTIDNLRIIKTSSSSVVNAPMAWTDLINKYHKHGRILITGEVNGLETSFESTIKSKISIFSTIPINSFDPEKLIKSDIGDGELVNAPFNENDQYDLEVANDN